jgi:hypothetical protein
MAEQLELVVTSAEWVAGRLTPDKLELIATRFEQDGLLVLNDAVPAETMALLKPRMLSDAAALQLKRAQHTGSRSDSGRKGHIWLGPPRGGVWARPELIANPIIEQVAARLLGPPDGGAPRAAGVVLAGYAGQCALPGSAPIRVHMDGVWEHATVEEARKAGGAWPSRCTNLQVNLNVLDVDGDNGATEVWPGSSREVGGGPDWKKKRTEPFAELGQVRLAAGCPPPQPNAFRVGAAAFRDARVWHRGVENRSAWPRPNIQLIYTAARMHKPSDDPGTRHLFEAEAAPAFRRLGPGVDRNVAFVPGRLNHLGNGAGPGGAVVGVPDPRVNFARPTTDEELALVEKTLALAKL